MRVQKPLSLPHRLESPHPSLPYSGRLVGLLCSIIAVLFSTVDCARNQFPVSNIITPQLIRHDLSRLAAMASQ